MNNIFSAIFLTGFLLIEGIRDFRKHQVSLVSIAIFAVIGILLGTMEGFTAWKEMLVGTLPGIILLLMAKITNEKIGYGDGFMIMVTGLYLGLWKNTLLLMFSLFLAAAASILLLVTGKGNKKTELPFAAFLLTGYFIMIKRL